MTTVRCPSCLAALPAEAAWCTLCYARLDAPKPATEPLDPWVAAALDPVPLPVPVAASAPVAVLEPVPVLEQVPALEPVPAPETVPAPEPLSPPAAAATAVAEAPTWPCTTCGSRVPLAETACVDCGMPFLGGVNPNVSLKVPGVGDLVTLSGGARFGVMAGGAATLTVVLVLVLLVLGHIF